MKSIKSLIFEQQAAPAQQAQQPAQPQQPQQPQQKQDSLAPYRSPARMIVNGTKNIDPWSEQGKQLRGKLKNPMEQFVDRANPGNTTKLGNLFIAIEEEAKKQGLNDQQMKAIILMLGLTVGYEAKELLRNRYNISTIQPQPQQ